MKTTSFEVLAKSIEQVIQEHLAASRKAAENALQRAFAAAGGPLPKASRSLHPGGGWQRRAPTEITALAERFYQAVCAKPGETMAVLAAEIGVSAYDLHRPMMHLKQAGRVRSVGQRHLTRYFPMAATTARSA